MNCKYSVLLRGVLVLLLAFVCQIQQPQAGKGKPSGGGGGGGKTVDVPVQVTLADREGDAIRSGVGGSIYSNGTEGVLAIIDASQGWLRLYTCNSANPKSPCLSTGRTQVFHYTSQAGWLFLNDSHTAGGNFSVHPVDEYGVQLPNGFRDVMGNPRVIAVATMKIIHSDVNDDGSFVTYTTRFAPGTYPESNYVLVTYHGGTLDCTNDCASWTVEALSSDEDVAQLLDSKNVNQGLYHMPFMLTVTVKQPQ